MFAGTPADSVHHANLFDFCEFLQPGAGGVCETPVEAHVHGRQARWAWSRPVPYRLLGETSTNDGAVGPSGIATRTPRVERCRRPPPSVPQLLCLLEDGSYAALRERGRRHETPTTRDDRHGPVGQAARPGRRRDIETAHAGTKRGATTPWVAPRGGLRPTELLKPESPRGVDAALAEAIRARLQDVVSRLLDDRLDLSGRNVSVLSDNQRRES